MTNEQILKKAIEKAEKNGWEKDFDHYVDDNLWIYEEDGDGFTTGNHYPSIIFSHDFAKAFWGEGKNDEKYQITIDKIDWSGISCSRGNCQASEHMATSYQRYKLFLWEYHLQQMIKEKEPIKYLKKFL